MEWRENEQQLSTVCSAQVMGQRHGNGLIEVVTIQWQALRPPTSCCYSSTDFALENRKKSESSFLSIASQFPKKH